MERFAESGRDGPGALNNRGEYNRLDGQCGLGNDGLVLETGRR